jgi:hypothetical protein
LLKLSKKGERQLLGELFITQRQVADAILDTVAAVLSRERSGEQRHQWHARRETLRYSRWCFRSGDKDSTASMRGASEESIDDPLENKVAARGEGASRGRGVRQLAKKLLGLLLERRQLLCRHSDTG